LFSRLPSLSENKKHSQDESAKPEPSAGTEISVNHSNQGRRQSRKKKVSLALSDKPQASSKLLTAASEQSADEESVTGAQTPNSVSDKKTKKQNRNKKNKKGKSWYFN